MNTQFVKLDHFFNQANRKKKILNQINNYYDMLNKFEEQKALSEGTVETAFKNLLIDISNLFNFTLIKESIKTKNGTNIIPDGIIRDEYRLTRGLWEAKDTKDNLHIEIPKKIQQGYPLKNIIFEDTKNLFLYQNGIMILENIDMKDPNKLFHALNIFFCYTAPDINDFYEATEIFKENIPNLSQALYDKIEEIYLRDEDFGKAIHEFIEKQASFSMKDMNEEDVKDMLIQHLLTERIFRNVFDNPEFKNRNIIALEIEKLVEVLIQKEFSKKTFFKSINHFYKAIETAASNIEDFYEKQSFLNEVYEMFFQSYSKKNADINGIVYTPTPIVKFMVHFTENLLKSVFKKTFSSEKLNIIDPCVGTGTFILEIMEKITLDKLENKYREDIYCNEIMLLPYYISSVNIEYNFFIKIGKYLPFENIIYADSLDLIEDEITRHNLDKFIDINAQRAIKELNKSFYVIIGNPPYNASQANENENNPNTKNEKVDKLIRETYSKDSNARLKNKLYDPYVKFFKWASERLRKSDGIICFISNNSFIEDIQFDGMRKHLFKDFNRIYHLNLGGDVYSNPKLSGSKHNVFGIKVGVGITFLIKSKKLTDSKIFYYKTDEYLTKYEKYDFLLKVIADFDNIEDLINIEGYVDKDNNFIFKEINKLRRYDRYIPLYNQNNSSEGIFETKFPGISTNRNDWVYDYSKFKLKQKMEKTIEFFNSEVGRYKRKLKTNKESDIEINAFIKIENDKIKWSRDLKKKLKRKQYVDDFKEESIVSSIFRPFIKKFLYYERSFVDSPSKYSEFVNKVNPILICSGKGAKKISFLVTNEYPNLDLLEKSQTFPLYLYDKEGIKKENITDFSANKFRNKLENETISKEDIYFYIYGVLHHPQYLETYMELFKKSFPKIPISKRYFDNIRVIGKKLYDIHLNFENIEEYDLNIEIDGNQPFNYKIQRLRLTNDKSDLIYNNVITIKNIPIESYNYIINGRSPLEWIVDQFKKIEYTDDSLIKLIKKSISISLETLKLKEKLKNYKLIY